MNRTVKCTVCKMEYPVGRQVEAAERAHWTCHRCANGEISLDLLDFIRRKIHGTRAQYEKEIRFVLRELVQNADDAGATIVVLRFESEALYLANNGRAFTTTSTAKRLSDFDAISAILKQSKAEDEEMTGHFGSGFQTVYALTNAPEVHSSGRSGRMNPVDQEWAFLEDTDSDRLVSPYLWRADDEPRGVLFRFPWRDDLAAMENFGGKHPFSDDKDWPRWNGSAIREAYDDLREYVHPLLLCCNHVRVVRLVWAASGKPESYQAERDFALKEMRPDAYVGHVTEGKGASPQAWYSWTSRSSDASTSEWRSYQLEGWKPGSDSRTFSYLIRSSYVSDDKGSPLFIGQRADGAIAITYDVNELKEKKKLKTNDIHVLLPLFDSKEGFRGDGTAFLYSVIPLPTHSGNRFAFSGHFFPTEDRTDVAVNRLGGRDGEWHQDIVLSVGRLYRDTFPLFLQMVQNLKGVDDSEKQKIVLNAVPGVPLHQWMRPGKDVTFSQWADQLNHQILVTVVHLPIMYCDRGWVPPVDAHWPSMPDGSIDPSGFRVLRMFAAPVFTKEFVGHPNFTATLSGRLQGRKLDSHTVMALFADFMKANGGELAYGRKLRSGRQLATEEVSNLIEFFITRRGAWTETMGLAVVPGQDGVMRALSDYKIIPGRFDALSRLLSPSMLIHADFAKPLETVSNEIRTLNADKALELLARLADEQTTRFTKLSEKDHSAVTSLLIAVCADPDFKLKPAHAGLRFIPFRVNGQVCLGLPNAEVGPGGKRTIFEKNRGDYYRRDYIFLPPESLVPGLTPEVRNRIQFLDLKDADKDSVNHVGEVLHILGLQDEDRAPTNFVRHFLSDRFGSLFHDEVLGPFIGTKDPKILDRQKRVFLEALPVYYDSDTIQIAKGSDRYGKTEDFLTPRAMGKVRCVYDTAGKWGCPADFAMDLTQDLEILGYKALNPDFSHPPWHWRTLEAIGVERRPQPAKVVEKVQSLVGDAKRNRRVIADIVALILTSDQVWADQLRELEQTAWIPTRDGLVHRQRETVVPSAENRRLLGNDFPFMLDSAACSAPLRARLGPECEGVKPDRARDLNLLQRPNLSMLLEFTSSLVSHGTEPPRDLFRLLAKSIAEEDPSEFESGFYYHSGKWWEGKHIVISDDAELKKLLGDSILFVRGSEVVPVEGYLHAIHARNTVGPSDFLERVSVVSSSKANQTPNREEVLAGLWTRLEQASDAIDEATAASYRSQVTYPVAGGQIAPSRIILFPDSDRPAWPEDGWIGEWFALPASACRHPHALQKLGAKSPQDLSAKDLRGLIESIHQSRRILGTTALDTVAYLVLKWHKLEPTADLRTSFVWPVERGAACSLERVGGWYIRDDSFSSYFEGAVGFLHEPSLPQIRQEFLELAVQYAGEGCLVSRAIRSDIAGSTSIEDDTALEARIGLMAEAFRVRFGTAYRQAPGSIDWLKGARACRTDRLRTTLSLGGVQRNADSPCMLSRKDDQVTILRVEVDPSLPDRLTSTIVQECLRRGFPVDGGADSSSSGKAGRASATRDGFEDLTYRLLTRDPQEWGFFVPGLRQILEWVPPLLEIEAEARRGYSETKRRLLEMYGRCQICGRRTPKTADGSDTCELVRSIVSNRGGLYSGGFDAYTIGNALFLCPSHHALYLRRLVRLPDIDKARTMGPEGALKVREMANRPTSNILVEVFETPEGGHDPRPRWRSLSLATTPDHAAAILKWMAEWMEREER